MYSTYNNTKQVRLKVTLEKNKMYNGGLTYKLLHHKFFMTSGQIYEILSHLFWNLAISSQAKALSNKTFVNYSMWIGPSSSWIVLIKAVNSPLYNLVIRNVIMLREINRILKEKIWKQLLPNADEIDRKMNNFINGSNMKGIQKIIILNIKSIVRARD